MDLACHPDITVILSNTTESGIVHDPDARLADAPAASFPAKLTQLLHHRWHRLGGGSGTGWQVIACELIDRGATVWPKFCASMRQTGIWAGISWIGWTGKFTATTRWSTAS